MKTNDFVFVHVEAPDEAGHCKDYALKVKTIENLDKRLLGRILDGLKEPYAIQYRLIILHPSKSGHTQEIQCPSQLKSPSLKPDGVKKFDEESAKNGTFGLIQNDYLISLLIASSK